MAKKPFFSVTKSRCLGEKRGCSLRGLSVRTLPVCNVGDPSGAWMKSYGLAALAPLAITHPSPRPCVTGDTCRLGRGMNAIATANHQIDLSEFDSKMLPERAEEFSEFLLLTVSPHADIRTWCTLMKTSCKKKFLFAVNVHFKARTGPKQCP